MKTTTLIALLSLSVMSSSGADLLWDGSSSANLGNFKNWNLNRIPNLTDNVVFPESVTQKALINDLGTPLFQKLVFKDNGYSLSGTPIRLAAGGIELVDSTAFDGTTVIGVDVNVLGDQTFFVGGQADGKDPQLILNGNVNLRTFHLTVAGGAATVAGNVVSGANEASALIFNGVAKTISSSGKVTLPDGTVSVEVGNLDLAGEVEAKELNVIGGFSFAGILLSLFTGTGIVDADFGSGLAVIRPGRDGSGFGRLTFTQRVNFGALTTVALKLGTPTTPGVTYDQIRIDGSMESQGASLSLTPGKGFAPALGQVFQIIDKTSAGLVRGTLGFTEGATISVGNAVVRLSFRGGDGNDVTATVVELAPTISKVPDQVVNEEGVLDVSFTIADPNTPVSRLSVTGSAENATVTILGSGSARTARIRPAANFFSSGIPVTLSVSDGALSVTETFSLLVNPVNDAPAFSAISTITIIPNSSPVSVPSATGLSVGPGESVLGQTLRFEILSNSNPGLFRVQPSIAPDGKLTCTPFDVEGTALLSIRVVDDGGTANGGVNASPPQQIELQLGFPQIPPLVAATTTWDGSETANWGTPANWSTGTLPGSPAFPAVLPSGRRTISTVGGASAGSLLFSGDGYRILDNPAGFSITGDIEVAAGNSVEIEGRIAHTPLLDRMVVAIHQSASLRLRGGLISQAFLGNNPSTSGNSLAAAALEFFFGFFQRQETENKNLFFMFESGGLLTLDGISQMPAFGGDGQDLTIVGPGRTVLNGSLEAATVAIEDGSAQVLEVNGTLTSSLTYPRSAALRGRSGTVQQAFAGGRLQPGGSGAGADQIGLLTISDLRLSNKALRTGQITTPGSLELDLGAITTPGTTYDQLKVTTLNITAGAALVLRPASGFAPVSGQVYTLVNVAGTFGGRVGNFAGLPEGSIIRVDGADMRLSYFGGDGNDIIVTVENQTPIILGLASQALIEDGTQQTQTFTFTNTSNLNPTITTQTSNPDLIPLANIGVSGTGSTRTITFITMPHQHGTARITWSVDDGVSVGTNSFDVTVLPVNDVPSFTKGPNVTAARNGGPQNLFGWATAISAGPSNENTQTLSFEIVSNSNPDIFTVLPAISASGALTFTPKAQVSGTTTVGVQLKDSGGTVIGGVDTSAVQTFTITTQASNSPPSFTSLGNVRVTAGTTTALQWATVTSFGSPDESSQNVSFRVEPSRPELFSTLPTVDSAGVLTISPLLSAGGESTSVFVRAQDNGGTAGGGVDISAAQSFTILIETNAPPVITGLASQQLLEGAPQQLQVFRLFNTDTASPTISVETSNPAVIPAANIVLTPLFFAGSIAYSPLADASGATTITVSVDDGNAATSVSFVVTVQPVNDAPSFIKGPDLIVPRNASPQSLLDWASNVIAGPDDEDGQAIIFEITSNSNPGIFTALPQVNAVGTLTFTPNPESSGSATISLRLKDDGGTEDGGADTSAEQTFTITILPTNNAPTFTPGPSVVAAAGATTTVPWATSLSAGSADESAQTLAFTIETNRPELFTTPPTLSPSGEFSVSPVAGAAGDVTFSVQLQDNGGTADGGLDRGTPVGLTLRIGNVIRTPGSYFGLAEAAPTTTPVNARTGFLTVTVTKPGSFTGKLILGGTSYNLTGTFGNAGLAIFGKAGALLPLARKGLTPLSLSLQVSAVTGDGKITGSVLDAGQPFAVIDADRAIFNAKTNPMLSWIVDGQGNNGKFTAAFPALSAPNQGLGTSAFPQGDGWATLTIGLDGKATMVGQLADGTAITLTSFLTAGNRVAFYASLYAGTGSISGRASYQNLETSDATGADFRWFRPVQLLPRPAPLYPNGWPGGINVDFEASRLVDKAVPYLGALTAVDLNGNLLITVDGLPQKAANLDPKNKITLVTLPDVNKLTATMTATTGRWTGSFTHPTDLKSKPLNGVILQKSNRATGFYLGPQGSGLASFAATP